MKQVNVEEPKSAYEVVRDYAGGLDVLEASAAKERAYSLLHSTGRFRPLEQYVAIVPAAAHEESPETVSRAVDQYARQAGCGAFTLVLGLNWPADTRDLDHVETLVRHTKKLAEDYSNLDIRILSEQYTDPTIGRIRRDLWNAVLVAGLESGTIRSGLETVGMNGDIDLVHMPRHTVGAIQTAMHKELAPPR